MAFLDRLFGRTEEYDDYDDYGYEEEVKASAEAEAEPAAYAPRARQRGTRVVDIRQGRVDRQQSEVVLLAPNDPEMTWQICDYVRDGKTAICNIEGIAPESRQRFVDFIRGAAYALDGVIRPISKLIFVVAPKTTLVSSPEAERQEEAYQAQAAAYEAQPEPAARGEYRPFRQYAR